MSELKGRSQLTDSASRIPVETNSVAIQTESLVTESLVAAVVAVRLSRNYPYPLPVIFFLDNGLARMFLKVDYYRD